MHADQLTETGGHALVDVFLIRSDIAVHYPEVLQSCYSDNGVRVLCRSLRLTLML